MDTPKTLEEQIAKVHRELEADEQQLSRPALTLVIVMKLREPGLYKRVRDVLNGN